jgi:hypothetical protein
MLRARAKLPLPRDHGICLADSTAFIARSFEALVRDFSREFLQLLHCRLVRVPSASFAVHGI